MARNPAIREITAFASLDACNFDLEAQPAGISNVLLPSPGVALVAGTIRPVFARRFVGAPGATALGVAIDVTE